MTKKPATPRTAKLKSGCEALFSLWRADSGDDPAGSEQLSEQIGAFRCELGLDLNGDGREDRAYIGEDRVAIAEDAEALANEGDEEPRERIRIGISWADGHHSVVGAKQAGAMHSVPAPEPDPDSDIEVIDVPKEYSWLMHWKVMKYRDGAIQLDMLGKETPIEAPGALGDGIMISGTDAAAVLYFTKHGWRAVHLGF